MLWCCGVFFFQAEDGIRDLVRSRGLGDVYKRQVLSTLLLLAVEEGKLASVDARLVELGWELSSKDAVSYTHLTLPTSDLV